MNNDTLDIIYILSMLIFPFYSCLSLARETKDFFSILNNVILTVANYSSIVVQMNKFTNYSKIYISFTYSAPDSIHTPANNIDKEF